MTRSMGLEKTHDSSSSRAQQDRGQRGRERQRVEGRDRDGEGDGQRELLVENAGGAGEEADRNEDGDEHERGGDDGAGDLGHGARVAWCGSLSLLGDVALHVLDDDDGVVDDQAGGQGDAEERQRVDGEAEDLDEGEGADERDGNGDGRDDGGAPVLQEEEDDDDDDDDGLAEGLDDFADGLADDGRGVDGDDALHAGREGLREFGRARLWHRDRPRARWRWRAAGRRRRWRRWPLKLQVGGVVFCAEFGAADVLEQDDAAAACS